MYVRESKELEKEQSLKMSAFKQVIMRFRLYNHLKIPGIGSGQRGITSSLLIWILKLQEDAYLITHCSDQTNNY